MRKLDIFTHIWPKKFHECLAENHRPNEGHAPPQRSRADDDESRSALRGDGHVRGATSRFFRSRRLHRMSPVTEQPGASFRASAAMAWLNFVKNIPDRFPSFIASVAMRDPEGAVEEARRAVKESRRVRNSDLFQRERQSRSMRPNSVPCSREMQNLGKPIWIHPARTGKISRLSDRAGIALRNLVDVRLALRIQRGAGANRFFQNARRDAESENHHPSRGGHGRRFSKAASARAGTSSARARRTWTTSRC